MFEFYKVLALGGWVMIPIGIVSVLALGLFLERVWSLQRSRVFPAHFVERTQGLIRGGKLSEALVLCQRDASSMALVISAGLMNQGQTRDRVKEAIEERGRLEAGRLDRFVEGLGTIAAIAPLLGLLGTVLGMIDVFKEVDAQAAKGVVHLPDLAGGIWKALITTAAGLTIAIPTFVGYKWLGTRINRLVLDMEEAAQAMVDLLTLSREDAAAPGTLTPAPEAPPPKPEREAPEEKEPGAENEADEAEAEPPKDEA